MRKLIYKVAQKLYNRKLFPWFLWSVIYDRWHKLFEIDKKYDKRAIKKSNKLRNRISEYNL